MKNFFLFLWGKKYLLLVIILLAAGGFYVYSKKNATDGQFVKLANGSLVNEVSVAGKVVATKDTDLSFETGGTVASVSRDVGSRVSSGDIVVALDTKELQASLAQAQANLAAEQAKLDQLENNDNEATQVTTAKRKLLDSIVDGFTAADDAVRNKSDQFFTDPNTMNPKILFAFNDYDLKEKINKERITVGETLSKWEKLDSQISADSISSGDADTARGYLTTIKSFLNDVSRAVNGFEPNDTLSQTTIDKYKSDVAMARTNVNSALSALTSAQEGIRSTSGDKPVQAARVKSAQAAVDALNVQIEKMYIRAPFAGVVSKQDAKIGEAVSPHVNLVSLISDSYEIEGYIPELNISGVDVKDPAQVTLDAFGPNQVWKATVIKIDPAETVKDGVATYKVRLAFDSKDERVRPGMTANIKIETGRKDNVNYLPLRAVVSRDGKNYVKVQVGKNIVEKEISIGEKDSRGNVEVLSGVSSDDSVLLTP